MLYIRQVLLVGSNNWFQWKVDFLSCLDAFPLKRMYRPYLKRHACRLAFVCAREGAMPDAPLAKFGLHLKPAVRRAALKHGRFYKLACDVFAAIVP